SHAFVGTNQGRSQRSCSTGSRRGPRHRWPKIQHLASYSVQRCRGVQRSSRHENLQDLLTRTAIREEPLSDLQECIEDFTSHRATALSQSNLPLGKRELLH